MDHIFVKWMDALVGHFFNSKDECEEVYLYVDSQILDQIGNENGLGRHEDFLKTFLISQEEKARIYDQLYYEGFLPHRTPQINRILYSNSILDFAKLLATARNGRQLYFPYIVLSIYIASLTDQNSDSAVGRFLMQYLREHLQNENGNYSSLEFLFGKLHHDFPMFRNNLRGNHRYVGLLKYHLLLSKNEIRGIQDALFRTSFVDDFSLTYVDKILKIKDYVNDHVKDILKVSLSNSDYQYRINNIFETFDLESYRNSHQNQTATSVLEDFALYLDFSEGRGFKLLSSYRPSGKTELCQGENHFTFTPSIDSIDSYNNEFVELNGNEFVELKEYSLKNQNLEIKPIALGDVVFFYKQREGGYIQSRNSYNKKVYIFVKKERRGQKIEQWESWAAQNATNCRRIDESYDVSDLTQERWALYLADGLTAPYHTKQEGWNLINKVRSISKRGGIKCGNNVYLVNALPYFEFPDDINEQGLNLIVKKEGSRLSHNVDYRFFIQGNKLIIDLIKDIDYEDSRLIEVTIKYTSPETNEQLTPDTPDGKLKFYVRGQNIVYDQEKLYSFNKWGEMSDRDERHIQGNVISGITHRDLGRASHVIETNDLSKDYADPFYFINLLASCIYMEPDGKIIRQRLEKCIKYTSTRLDIQSNEDGFTTKVISLLVNSGYIAADYRTSHYQAIPPAFIKIPRSFHAGSTNQVWMLTGAYTRNFMKDLDDFCTKNTDGSERKVSVSKKIRYSKTLDNSRGSLKLLPPIILLASNFDPEEFKKRFPYHFFDVIKTYDQSLDLLSLVSPISEYEKTMETIPRERVDVSRFVRPKSKEFPRVREDNPYEYNNHIYIEKSEKGDFFKPSISEKWNELFCYYKRNKPFIIKGTQHIYLPEDLRLPSLIQRSLFITNVGLPKYQKVFLCDIPTTQLYTSMKSYKINDDRLNTFFERTTGKNNEADKCIKEKIISSQYIRDGEWKYSLNLWVRKEDEEFNNTIPKRLLVLTYTYRLVKNIESREVAVSTHSNNGSIRNYVLQDGAFQETNLDHITVFSSIIKSGSNCNIPFTEKFSIFTLPNKDLYNVEEIIIL